MKKLSSKLLLAGLVILLTIFIASRLFRSPSLEGNMRKDLLTLDTAAVTEVRILPSKDHTEELRLFREGKNWMVAKGDRREASNNASMKNMLGTMMNMHAQRLASRSKEKWEDFKVGQTSTHVSVYNSGKKVADFHVGKLGFTRNSGGGFGGSYTYVRLNDENEVYIVEGFLETQFNGSFNDWRDKTFSKFNKMDVTQISFHYPADSSFVVEKKDSTWYVDGEKSNPAMVMNFVGQLSSKYLTEFADGYTPSTPADVTVEVDGKSGNLVKLEAWKRENDWILTSSTQKGVYFSSKGSNAVADILIGKRKLRPKIQ